MPPTLKHLELTDQRGLDAGVRELLAAGLAPAAVRELEQKLSLRGVAAVRAAHKAGSLDLAAGAPE